MALGIGIAGHPEGHPSVNSGILLQAMADKYAYAENTGLAMHVTTQFLFDVMPLVRWRAEALATFLTAVPLDVGLAGLARMMTSMSFAKDCGVASSFPQLRIMLAVCGTSLPIIPRTILCSTWQHSGPEPASRYSVPFTSSRLEVFSELQHGLEPFPRVISKSTGGTPLSEQLDVDAPPSCLAGVFGVARTG